MSEMLGVKAQMTGPTTWELVSPQKFVWGGGPAFTKYEKKMQARKGWRGRK